MANRRRHSDQAAQHPATGRQTGERGKHSQLAKVGYDLEHPIITCRNLACASVVRIWVTKLLLGLCPIAPDTPRYTAASRATHRVCRHVQPGSQGHCFWGATNAPYARQS